jgi:hypothetical protein
MTRKIKFRGKRVDNNEWVYGFYSVITDPITKVNKHGILAKDKEYTKLPGQLVLLDVWHQIIPETLGQYTGLYDIKSAKEIYEGDSVIDKDIKGMVEWDSNKAKFIVKFDRFDVKMTRYFHR